MTVAAFAPPGVQDLLADSLRSVPGVRGDTLDEVRRTFYAGGTTRLRRGRVVCCRRRPLQAVRERCWRLPRAPLRAAVWRRPLWLVLWLVYLPAQAPPREGFGAGPAVGLTMSPLSATLLRWTQYLLLSGRIGWRSLLPGAVLAGTGTVALSGAARLVLPIATERGLDEFGPLGPGLHVPVLADRPPPRRGLRTGLGRRASPPATGTAQAPFSGTIHRAVAGLRLPLTRAG